MKAVLTAAISLVLLAQIETAVASTAFVAPSDKFPASLLAVHYVADPGEVNHVTVDFGEPFGHEIEDTGATITPGAGCTAISPNRVHCTGSDSVFEVELGDGDDFLAVDVDGLAALRGGDGDDRIDGGFNEFDTEYLFGGAGNDVLRGRAGRDILNGGPGADLMSGGTSCEAGLAGLCFIHDDTLTYAGRTNRVRADADIDAADDGERDEGDTIIADVEHIIGGKGNDVLGGVTTNFFTFDSSRRLVGMRLEGRAGDDKLRGTRAPDTLLGGVGNDVSRGAGRGDAISAGRGNDALVGDAGRDRLRAGKGQDRLFARDHQRDRVNGGPGADSARVDLGLDVTRSIGTFF